MFIDGDNKKFMKDGELLVRVIEHGEYYLYAADKGSPLDEISGTARRLLLTVKREDTLKKSKYVWYHRDNEEVEEVFQKSILTSDDIEVQWLGGTVKLSKLVLDFKFGTEDVLEETIEEILQETKHNHKGFMYLGLNPEDIVRIEWSISKSAYKKKATYEEANSLEELMDIIF